MKRFLLLFSALAMLALAAMTAGDRQPNALRVIPHDGDPLVLLFSGRPEVKFAGNALTVSSSNPLANESYTFGAIDSFRFEYVAESGVTPPDAVADVTVRRDGMNLVIANLPEGSRVALYTVGGTGIYSATATETLTIDLSSRRAGVYILQINKSAIKIKL